MNQSVWIRFKILIIHRWHDSKFSVIHSAHLYKSDEICKQTQQNLIHIQLYCVQLLDCSIFYDSFVSNASENFEWFEIYVVEFSEMEIGIRVVFFFILCTQNGRQSEKHSEICEVGDRKRRRKNESAKHVLK